MNTFSAKHLALPATGKTRLGLGLAMYLFTAAPLAAWAASPPTASDAVATPSVTTPSVTTPSVVSPVNSRQSQPAAPLTPTAQSSVALQDFSPLALYRHADGIVKTVILILIFASLLSWSIWIGKTGELLVRGRRMKMNLGQFSGKRSLRQCEQLASQSCEQMRTVALSELNHIKGQLSPHAIHSLKERVLAQIQRIEATEARRATRGASILATTSAVAPFIGLFGTVWGIMHSFISIAQSQTTNLSVVAPGIAEALFATALGLVVAIPAVILYNITGRLINGYRLILSDAMTHTMCLLSHDLDAVEAIHPNILTSAA